MSSVQSTMKLPKSTKTQKLSGFEGQVKKYVLSAPIPIQCHGITAQHSFIITEALDFNLLARDLICLFGLKIEAGDKGMKIIQTVPRQYYTHRIPQWWALDLHDHCQHVTVAYDKTGSNEQLEQFYQPLLGHTYEVTFKAKVQGPPGTAEAVEIPQELWNQEPGTAPHVTLHVNESYHAKDLGPLVYQTLLNSNPDQYDTQCLAGDVTIKYYQIPKCHTTILHHCQVREVTEFIDPYVWSQSSSHVGLTNVTPVQVTLKPSVQLPSVQQYPIKKQAMSKPEKETQWPSNSRWEQE